MSDATSAVSEDLDLLYRDAVATIDAGDVSTLEGLLLRHPRLVRDRLESPGAWLRDQVGGALEGYFKQPHLLWFVAENPIRNGRLPRNIAQIARTIVEAAQREQVKGLQEQLEYTLGLVTTGRIPRDSGVQLELMDALIDAGARPGAGNGALGGGNLEAAGHLVARGGELTLATALCLGSTDDVTRMGRTASSRDRQIALAAAALNGKAEALTTLIGLGVDLSA